MKKLILPLLALAFVFGCSKVEIGTLDLTHDARKTAQVMKPLNPVFEDTDKAMQDIDKIVSANRARLAGTARSRKGCMSHIEVPRHFATIQEAVDNACDGAVITVKSGTYTELVVVEKPGLKFKANGAVTLHGGFVLHEGADDTTIQQFTIVVGAGTVHGIQVRNITGGRIVQNTISDPVHLKGTAVRIFNGNKITVHGNTISGTGWGIFFGSLENGGCHDNTISNNYITGMTNGSVIGLQGNCDNNFINENTLMDNPTLSNAAILLLSGDFNIVQGYCDNNVVKNNTCNTTYNGIMIALGGTNNKIGPYNTTNNNQLNGILITGSATGNVIFDNTALGNGICDILNNANDPVGNTFTNNIAGCTTGL